MEVDSSLKQEIEAVFIARHGEKLYRKLADTSVAVCGLGGLGSHIALSLARAGIGRLHLIDFDEVDLSNIHRQQYFLSQIGEKKTIALKNLIGEIAPLTEVCTDTIRITEENFAALLKEDDIICEAFDKAKAKAMLVNGVSQVYPEKYLVAASGMAGLSAANSIKTRKITGHFYLCGDGKSDVADAAMMAPRVMLCAAHQAQAVIRICAGEFEV